ncbi:MAG: hypothetical protein ACSLFK_09775 [Gemmatimonadaceae bacterium]
MLALPAGAGAQLPPGERWLTIETPNFRVHFTRELEAEGRRGAINAERAWAELSTELKAPRGKVDLVIADNVDYVNGYATPFPSNRIVIFAHPPVASPGFRNYDDWSRLVITHELAHIFHLDRADGLWRAGRRLFGRHPALFPNGYQPSWLIEGLAVYYESRITGAGRLEGSDHYMIARAAAEVSRVPRIGELSRETSRFPGGEVVYAYGGQIFDYLARTRGPEKIPEFIDITSRVLFPLSLNRKAKRAFGISFENAWRDWRDSLVREAGAPRDPLPQWRELSRDGRYAAFPRWLGDTAILYTGANGKEVTSAFAVTLGGDVTRLGRRNGLDANVPMADGSILFAQPDFTDPFHLRNDLYIEKGGRQQRLTHGARLSHPDAASDGRIVAVQSLPGATRLVRVDPKSGSVEPITSGSAEVQWAEPRWSPDGTAIAAVRVIRGGISEILILDQAGKVRGIAVSGRAIVSSPAWSSDGSRIYYSSNNGGSTQLYVTALTDPVTAARGSLLSAASTGAFNPEPSPGGESLAALSFRFDGYHVGYAPIPRPAVAPAARTARDGCRDCILASPVNAPTGRDDLRPARPYSAARSLLPRYWEPIVGSSSSTGALVGAATSGSDVIGRHAYAAQLIFDTRHRETEAGAVYRYAGFGQPFLNFSVSQEWEHFGIFDSGGEEVGDLVRRARTAGISASLVRPRVRTSGSLSFGADLESRVYATDPDTLLQLLSGVFGRTRRYPSIFASASWANTKRPGLSISREDGVSLSMSARQRWESGDFASGSSSVVGVAAAYQSLDLPGFAHHVIAVRGAAGYADRRAISTFSAGGLSGGSLGVIAGVNAGAGQRTFGVRGFPPSAEQGIRALAGTVEYRVPLAAPSARIRFIPLLFDRISAAAFADAGRAWCPGGATGICETDRGGPWLASAGAELNLDTAIQYDFPARFRAGVAVPFEGRAAVGANSASVYLTIGSAF